MDGCRIVSVSLGRCLVEALDPARGEQSARPAQARRAAAGAAEAVRCGIAPSAPGCAPTPDAQVAPGAPQHQTLQAPSVAEAAQMAVKELPLTAPSVHLSVGDQAFVGVPVWLWIDRGTGAAGPVSATASAGAARVTATGRLVAVEWSLGPAGARVVCRGSGTPWRGQAGASPDCGYTYQLRSLPERTGGSGRWPVTATGVWQVAWAGFSAGAPVAGQQTVRLTTQTSLPVGEVQVLTAGGAS